jgi:hypothetical protein
MHYDTSHCGDYETGQLYFGPDFWKLLDNILQKSQVRQLGTSRMALFYTRWLALLRFRAEINLKKRPSRHL